MLKQAEQPANLPGLCAIPTMQVKGSNFHKILIPVKVLALFPPLKLSKSNIFITITCTKKKLIFRRGAILQIKIFMHFRDV